MMIAQTELHIILVIIVGPLLVIFALSKLNKGSGSESSDVGERASFWTRFWAYSIDGICIIILTSLVQFLFGGVTGIWFVGITTGRIIIGGLYFTYYFGTTGQTVGKKWMKIKVISADGTPMTLTKGFLRYIGYIISGVVLQLGFLWILFDKEDQGWHDKIAKTYVVKA